MSSISVTFVQALYSFKGKNNDELCFKKGDVITLTQKVDGGWWEGTLNEKTGWFPSNYVKEVSDIKSPITSPLSQKRQFYSIVLHDLSESEMKFVNELQGLITNYLNAIEKSSILNNHEYRQLTGNILELLDVHKSFLCNLEENEKKPFSEQKAGKLFLSCASKLQNVHQTYCSLHPKAACVLDKFKDQLGSFMETCGANCPGIIMLTTGLSKPFRRIDKYSGILQELERHIDENHHDRGDIQRSVAVYNDITAICTATRKQKELELQVLTGPVRGWDGASLAELGDIVHMGSVAIGSQNLDRYFVLFAQNLLILSVSQRMSAFIYEGKLPVSGLDVKRIEDNETYKNAFEITGPITDPIIAVCQTKAEAQYWFDLLRSKTVSIYSSSEKSETTLNARGYSNRCSVLTFRPSYPCTFSTVLPPANYPSTAPYHKLTKLFRKLLKKGLINSQTLHELLYKEFLSMTANVPNQSNSITKRVHRNASVISSGGGSGARASAVDDSHNEFFVNFLFKRQNASDSLATSDLKLRKVKLHVGNRNGVEAATKQYKAYENLTKMGTSCETDDFNDFSHQSSCYSLPVPTLQKKTAQKSNSFVDRSINRLSSSRSFDSGVVGGGSSTIQSSSKDLKKLTDFSSVNESPEFVSVLCLTDDKNVPAQPDLCFDNSSQFNDTKQTIFRSEIYCHWWHKTPITDSFLFDVYEQNRSDFEGKRFKCPTKAETSERKSADKSLGLFYGLRPNVSMFSSRQKNVTTSNGQGYRSSLTDEQDLTILRVIEAYCNSSSSVRTNSSSEHTTRIESIGELSEQTLIQNVLLIQEQIRELQKNFSQLKNELRNENKLLVPQSLSVSSNRNSNKTLDPVANSDICT